MSGYILCQTRKAERPYFIENISMNIYSIEELCYYLYHNIYLADATVFNEKLCDWLNDELKLPGLAAKVRQNLVRNVSAGDMLYPVFKEINYLTYEEMKTLNSRLTVLEKEHVAVRRKKKGDTLIRNGMYVNAIQVYQKLLESENLAEQENGFEAAVQYNLGCAYSYLFQMEKAEECFMMAYQKGHSLKALQAYLLAYRTTHEKTDDDRVLTELEVEETLKKEVKEGVAQALNIFSDIPERKIEEGNLDALLEMFIREYHRSTGS